MKKIVLLISFASIFAACAPQATEVSVVTPALEPSPTATLVIATMTQATATVIPTETLTPIASMRISPIDGMTQLFIPMGNVTMGAFDVFAEGDEKPGHLVQIDAFWMDQVEVTNGMYALCMQASACPKPVKLNSDNRLSYFDNPEFRDYPVVQVTWLDAKTYCEWAGRRLPTEAQWERAARGDDMRTYAWGCEPPNSLYANVNNDLGDTSRVGSYAAGASPLGVLDMTGNVWEWVADYYDPGYYAVSPDVDPFGPESPRTYDRVIRGGSYQDAMLDLRVSNRGYELGPNPLAAPHTTEATGRSSVRIGFRCAETD